MANTSKRGFASMDGEKQRLIASKGGKAAHAKGTAHEWSSEEARAAGRKGGESRGTRGQHMDEPVPGHSAQELVSHSNAISTSFLNDAGSSLRGGNNFANGNHTNSAPATGSNPNTGANHTYYATTPARQESSHAVN